MAEGQWSVLWPLVPKAGERGGRGEDMEMGRDREEKTDKARETEKQGEQGWAGQGQQGGGTGTAADRQIAVWKADCTECLPHVGSAQGSHCIVLAAAGLIQSRDSEPACQGSNPS